jgi:hypothetical protein
MQDGPGVLCARNVNMNGSEAGDGRSDGSKEMDGDGSAERGYQGDGARRDGACEVGEEEAGPRALQEKHTEEKKKKKEEDVEDVPPNGGYGWVCVACVATINA